MTPVEINRYILLIDLAILKAKIVPLNAIHSLGVIFYINIYVLYLLLCTICMYYYMYTMYIIFTYLCGIYIYILYF